MKSNRWTLLLVKDDDTQVRRFPVTLRRLRAFGALSLALILGLGGYTLFLALGGSTRVQARELAEENHLLESELQTLKERVSSMEASMGVLAQRDERIRQLAGMTGVDPEVLDVGIGGPGLESPESVPLFGVDEELGTEAFAVRYDLDVLERRAEMLLNSMDAAADSMTLQRDRLLATPSILPTAGLVTSRFSSSRFHPILHRWAPHEGVDIRADQGTPILAAAKGTIRRAGWQTGYGYTVEIDHGFGYVTRYAHASKLLVQRGNRVERGDVIAQVGRTGLATASHLHYEVHASGQPVNPLEYVIRGAAP